jgi:UDP-N-acetyl-D-mannosaminuronic acid dehydrogenase
MKKVTISIIGGAGHIGLPLGVLFACKNLNVNLIDINSEAINNISRGKFIYKEEKSKFYLDKALKKKKLSFSKELSSIKNNDIVIICIGTPINKNLQPTTKSFINFFKILNKHLTKNQIVIIRSSVFPGICEKIKKIIKTNNIAYCPERIVQGKSLTEMPNLTQIISGYTKKSINISNELFKLVSKKTIITSVKEAELIKLFSNAYRYIHFSIANQFYMICKKNNLNFSILKKNMIDGYNRNSSLPGSGLTAGPCLLKDTMQLKSFMNNFFKLGDSAMKINENLPIFAIREYEKKKKIIGRTVGILGMAFKPESDDLRDSLSVKLFHYLKRRKIKTLCSDPYVSDNTYVSERFIINNADIIFIGVPHKRYKKLKLPKNKVINVWENF